MYCSAEDIDALVLSYISIAPWIDDRQVALQLDEVARKTLVPALPLATVEFLTRSEALLLELARSDYLDEV